MTGSALRSCTRLDSRASKHGGCEELAGIGTGRRLASPAWFNRDSFRCDRVTLPGDTATFEYRGGVTLVPNQFARQDVRMTRRVTPPLRHAPIGRAEAGRKPVTLD